MTGQLFIAKASCSHSVLDLLLSPCQHIHFPGGPQRFEPPTIEYFPLSLLHIILHIPHEEYRWEDTPDIRFQYINVWATRLMIYVRNPPKFLPCVVWWNPRSVTKPRELYVGLEFTKIETSFLEENMYSLRYSPIRTFWSSWMPNHFSPQPH